ncbi:tripartite tricarboxylate transporter substrate binding protein [Hydrogenophaga sp.]|uniref:Bug family tripartite tricarboxylate transporter substrate binding protein n=1 Tax=Hydrogenophaga sp. TaxID=1904254 RepID=UPI00272605C0|nr:tripartite tricarboxylate transporter substrate binding protein [Hydrogenophaga sp.]MDO9438174.1 tripartite tricarboxylate transporter substrate binding protein [Hydrogenophaga sp.]
MNLIRLGLLCSTWLVCALAAPAQAQQPYPAKPIKVIVPFSAGSATDVVARMVGNKLAEAWGQQVVIDNKPGASGIIAATAAAKSPADGYTLFFTSNTTQAANPSLFPNLPYDPVTDFVPVAPMATAANLLVVSTSLGVSSVKELIQLAKAQPGKLSFASGSSLSRVNGEMFKSMTGIDIVHIAYKSNPQGVTDLLAGHVQLMFTDTVTALPHVKAGKLKALGIGSGKRSAVLADVPTVAEAGVPGYDLTGWLAVFAPAGTPQAVVNKLNEEINRILVLPEVRERLLQTGLDPLAGSPAELGALVRNEIPKWARIIKEAGIKPD